MDGGGGHVEMSGKSVRHSPKASNSDNKNKNQTQLSRTQASPALSLRFYRGNTYVDTTAGTVVGCAVQRHPRRHTAVPPSPRPGPRAPSSWPPHTGSTSPASLPWCPLIYLLSLQTRRPSSLGNSCKWDQTAFVFSTWQETEVEMRRWLQRPWREEYGRPGGGIIWECRWGSYISL